MTQPTCRESSLEYTRRLCAFRVTAAPTYACLHPTQVLDFVEGVFASRVLHLAFCPASTDDAIRSGEDLPGQDNLGSCSKSAERLVCMGHNADGTVTIKGLAASSLAEKFSLCLIEAPTCLRVATRRPILAIGFADGALNMVNFAQDRYLMTFLRCLGVLDDAMCAFRFCVPCFLR